MVTVKLASPLPSKARHTTPSRRTYTQRSFHVFVWSTIWLCAALGLTGCQDKPPESVTVDFSIRAQTAQGKPVFKARVLLNGNWVGNTNRQGRFSGMHTAKVKSRLKLSVEGNHAQMSVNYFVTPQKGPDGWQGKPIRAVVVLQRDDGSQHQAQHQGGKVDNRMGGSVKVLNFPTERRNDQGKPSRRRPSKRTTAVAQRRLPPARPLKGLYRPRCYRSSRGPYRPVYFTLSQGSQLWIKGDCNEQVPTRGRTQVKLQMPIGTFQSIEVKHQGSSKRKMFEVKEGKSAIRLAIQVQGANCALSNLQKKVARRQRLNDAEVACLRKSSISSSQGFAARLALASHFANRGSSSKCRKELDPLYQNQGHRFHLTRGLQLGIVYARCRSHLRALSLLQRGEKNLSRMPASTRQQNARALYAAMSKLYERRYFRSKQSQDLLQAVKFARSRLKYSRSGSAKSRANKELNRLQRLALKEGVIE